MVRIGAKALNNLCLHFYLNSEMTEPTEARNEEKIAKEQLRLRVSENIIKFGLHHPKWYVQLYTGFCLALEFIFGIIALIALFVAPTALLVIIPIFMVPPLLPLWYLRRRSKAKALAEKIAHEAKEREKRAAFIKEQRSKGLVPFIDRRGVERWGSPEEVEKWKRIDLALINNFANYSPREFEYFIGELFKRMGYSVEISEYVQDFGIDLVAKKEGEVVVVEVKKWQIGNNVGPEVIRSVLGAMWKVKANKAVVVTTSDFTVLAEAQANGAPVELWNAAVLRDLVEKYFIVREALKAEDPSH